jgi:sensor domain CHASE-containing protein
MTDDMRLWLPPMLTLLGTLVVVVFTAWLNTRAILAQMEALRQEVKKEIAELRLELKTELVEVKNRVKALEDRAGLIYRP